MCIRDRTDELRQLQEDERMSAQQKAQRAREIAKKETEKLFAGTEVEMCIRDRNT